MNIKDYVVSSKPDGVFSALYIDDTCTGYYLIYFSDTNHKKKFRKWYYNMYDREYVIHKSHASYLFGDVLYGRTIFMKKYKEHYGKYYIPCDNLLLELFVNKDPFYQNRRGTLSIMRFQDDKTYPDNINDVNDILNIMYNPIRLDELLCKKSIEWKRLYTEIENNECDDITHWA